VHQFKKMNSKLYNDLPLANDGQRRDSQPVQTGPWAIQLVNRYTTAAASRPKQCASFTKEAETKKIMGMNLQLTYQKPIKLTLETQGSRILQAVIETLEESEPRVGGNPIVMFTQE